MLGSTLKNITLWVTALLQCRISYVIFCGFCQTYFLNLACHAKHKLRLPIHSTSAQNSAFGFVKWMVRSLSRSPCLDDSVKWWLPKLTHTFFLLVSAVSASTLPNWPRIGISNEHRLRQELFPSGSNNGRMTRPVLNCSEAVTVKFIVQLNAVVDVVST